MFIAQLMHFLAAHHHAAWVTQYFTGTRSFQFIYNWAMHHGFKYQM